MARDHDRRSGFAARRRRARAAAGRGAGAALLREWLAYIPEILPVARALEAAAIAGEAGGDAWRNHMDDLHDQLGAAVARVDLAPGWTVDTATDWAWARVQPGLFEQLVTERGWRAEEYADRVTRSVPSEIVLPQPPGPREIDQIAEYADATVRTAVRRGSLVPIKGRKSGAVREVGQPRQRGLHAHRRAADDRPVKRARLGCSRAARVPEPRRYGVCSLRDPAGRGREPAQHVTATSSGRHRVTCGWSRSMLDRRAQRPGGRLHADAAAAVALSVGWSSAASCGCCAPPIRPRGATMVIVSAGTAHHRRTSSLPSRRRRDAHARVPTSSTALRGGPGAGGELEPTTTLPRCSPRSMSMNARGAPPCRPRRSSRAASAARGDQPADLVAELALASWSLTMKPRMLMRCLTINPRLRGPAPARSRCTARPRRTGRSARRGGSRRSRPRAAGRRRCRSRRRCRRAPPSAAPSRRSGSREGGVEAELLAHVGDLLRPAGAADHAAAARLGELARDAADRARRGRDEDRLALLDRGDLGEPHPGGHAGHPERAEEGAGRDALGTSIAYLAPGTNASSRQPATVQHERPVLDASPTAPPYIALPSSNGGT